MSKAPIERMVDNAMHCTLCDAKMGHCDCWEECFCGWSFRKGEKCNNPDHIIRLK